MGGDGLAPRTGLISAAFKALPVVALGEQPFIKAQPAPLLAVLSRERVERVLAAGGVEDHVVGETCRIDAAAWATGLDDVNDNVGLRKTSSRGRQPLEGTQAPGTEADNANSGHGNSKGGGGDGNICIFSSPTHEQAATSGRSSRFGDCPGEGPAGCVGAGLVELRAASRCEERPARVLAQHPSRIAQGEPRLAVFILEEPARQSRVPAGTTHRLT